MIEAQFFLQGFLPQQKRRHVFYGRHAIIEKTGPSICEDHVTKDQINDLQKGGTKGRRPDNKKYQCCHFSKMRQIFCQLPLKTSRNKANLLV